MCITLSLTAVLATPVSAQTDCTGDAEIIGTLEKIAGPGPELDFLLAILKFRYTNHCVHLNEIQVLGTHNSYHQQPGAALYDLAHSITPLVEA